MVVDDLRYAALTEGGLPYLAGDIAPGTNSYIRDAAGRPLPFGAGGDLVPLTLGSSFAGSSAGPYPIFTDGGDGVNPENHFSRLSPNHRYLLNVIGHYNLTTNNNPFVETSEQARVGKEL